MDSIWLRPESAAVGRPAEYTRAEVTAAAVFIAESQGFGAVSMRRVAAEMGTGAASLYRYVRNRDELLQLMAGSVYARLKLRRTGLGWRADLVKVGLESFHLLVDRPWFLDLLAEAPMASGGPSTARMLEHCLAVLSAHPAPGARKLEAVGVMGGMVQQYAGLVARPEVPGQLAAEAAYLAHVARSGGHPHLAALLAEGPIVSRDRAESPEDTLARLLPPVLDAVLRTSG